MTDSPLLLFVAALVTLAIGAALVAGLALLSNGAMV